MSETNEASPKASSNQAGHSEARSDGGLQPLDHSSPSDEHVLTRQACIVARVVLTD